MKAASVLIALGLAVGSASAQQLWQQSRVGMSVAEVIAAFPGAALAQSPTPNRDGSIDLVALPGVDIASCPFRASFVFQAEKLNAVRVGCHTPSPIETERVSKAVMEALRAKYGAEISQERSTIGTTHAWFSAGVKIQLEAIQIGSNDGLVNVFYTPSTGKDAGKL